MTTNAPLGEGKYNNINNNSNWENEEVWEVPMEHFNSPRKGEYVTAEEEYQNRLTFENPKLLQTPKRSQRNLSHMPTTPQKKPKYNVSSPKKSLKNSTKVRRTEPPGAPIKKKVKTIHKNRKSRRNSHK